MRKFFSRYTRIEIGFIFFSNYEQKYAYLVFL